MAFTIHMINLTFMLLYLLTTERSEVVPFFRAVQAKKKGREATLRLL